MVRRTEESNQGSAPRPNATNVRIYRYKGVEACARSTNARRSSYDPHVAKCVIGVKGDDGVPEMSLGTSLGAREWRFRPLLPYEFCRDGFSAESSRSESLSSSSESQEDVSSRSPRPRGPSGSSRCTDEYRCVGTLSWRSAMVEGEVIFVACLARTLRTRREPWRAPSC